MAAADVFIGSSQYNRCFCGVLFFPPAAGSRRRCHKVIPSIVTPMRPTMWKRVSVAMLVLLLPFLCWLCVEKKHPVATVTTMTTRGRNPWQSEG